MSLCYIAYHSIIVQQVRGPIKTIHSIAIQSTVFDSALTLRFRVMMDAGHRPELIGRSAGQLTMRSGEVLRTNFLGFM